VSFEEQITGHISEHIFIVKCGLLCLLCFKYFSQHKEFLKLKNTAWKFLSFRGGHILSCVAFRPVACEKKYLLDYKAAKSFFQILKLFPAGYGSFKSFNFCFITLYLYYNMPAINRKFVPWEEDNVSDH